MKTIYGHFLNKGELFGKVMIGACNVDLFAQRAPIETLQKRFAWFAMANRQGLARAGMEYLGHLLSREQIALYRAVTRDAHHFPELGVSYQQTIALGRTNILVAYLTRLSKQKGWNRRDAIRDTASYEALLRARVFENTLHGLEDISAVALQEHVNLASHSMWTLMSINNVEP